MSYLLFHLFSSFLLYLVKKRTIKKARYGKGHWPIQAGFDIDTPVKVRVMEGCLVVTANHIYSKKQVNLYMRQLLFRPVMQDLPNNR